MLTSYNATFGVYFLGEFDESLAGEFEEALGAHDAPPMHKAEVSGPLAEPVFV